jgi:S-adenosylmethionine:tRNA ribosyltransferase-isomerase
VRVADFDFDLPPDLIATRPIEPRDAARLLVVDRASGAITDWVFRDLPDLLEPGDLLVGNDAKVIPARLHGRRADTGGAVEVFLLRPEGARRWRALVNPGRRLRPGVRVAFDEGASCVVAAVLETGERLVDFEGAAGAEIDVLALAERIGAVPLPPYLRRDADAADRTDYQTVYARSPGAVAAPTAGLHVTPEVLARLAVRGVGFASVTLDVGPGTFRPVTVDDLDDHQMDEETYEIPAATAEAIARTKAAGRRVVALGTTVVRTLEAAASAVGESGGGRVPAGRGATRLFVKPGFRFRVIDALVTNFHLPKSTLLALVSAFGGVEVIRRAYAHAVAQRYRFYSYGDAMLIRPYGEAR